VAKKYRYNVSLSAEETQSGTIDLTKKEAEIVAYATNTDNWKNGYGGGYCGYFSIDIDNPMEIED
jgi:hypothetical protein